MKEAPSANVHCANGGSFFVSIRLAIGQVRWAITVRCIKKDTDFIFKISMLKNHLKIFFHEESKELEEMK